MIIVLEEIKNFIIYTQIMVNTESIEKRLLTIEKHLMKNSENINMILEKFLALQKNFVRIIEVITKMNKK